MAEHPKLGNLYRIEIYSVLQVKFKALVGSLCSMTLNPLERAKSRRILPRPFPENPIHVMISCLLRVLHLYITLATTGFWKR